MEIVKYLLTLPDIKEYSNSFSDYGFQCACANGHLDIVKYLLTSSELKEHADIHASDDLCFRYACEYGHLDIVQYLLTSSELKEHADIHAFYNDGFRLACKNRHFDIVKYLLTFEGAQKIDFLKERYNLVWALKNGYNDIAQSMLSSLSSDIEKYIDCYSLVEKYCLEKNISFEEWMDTMNKNNPGNQVNIEEEELFV